MKTTVQFMTTC